MTLLRDPAALFQDHSKDETPKVPIQLEEKSWVTTARSRPAVVVVVAGTQVTEVELEEPAFGSPVIDALDEGFVIADARNPGVRPNARIVAADGSTRLTFNAGDAIEQLLRLPFGGD